MLGNLKRVYPVLKTHTPNGVLGREFTLEVRKLVKKKYLQSDVEYRNYNGWP